MENKPCDCENNNEECKLGKRCEVCEKCIPDSFVNLLCAACYTAQVKEIEMRKEEEVEARKEEETVADTAVIGTATIKVEFTPDNEVKTTFTTPYNVNGITNPDYIENPEQEDKDQVQANLSQFQKTAVLLWHPTRMMYEFIKNSFIPKITSHPQYPKFIWKPTVVDVGCGCGVGSNILSQEADFVWGIDKNENSVKFAKEAFTRIKNGIYYNSQVTFDNFDFLKDTRETQKFDVVVAIEVIEHIYDYRVFLSQLLRFDTRNINNPTEYFISTPNRNNRHIDQKQPFNRYHVREWTAQEFHAVLSEYFAHIEFFSSAGEPTTIDTIHTPLLAKCWGAK